VEDIPLLAEHFARQAQSEGAPPVKFSTAAIKLLKNYNWQGNIRELENTILRAASLSDGIIYPEHLPERVSRFGEITSETDSENMSSDLISTPSSNGNWLTLSEMEEKYVVQVLSYTGGNKQAAARLLNIDRKTLSRIIKRGETVEN